MKFSMLAIAGAALAAGVEGFSAVAGPARSSFGVRQVSSLFRRQISAPASLVVYGKSPCLGKTNGGCFECAGFFPVLRGSIVESADASPLAVGSRNPRAYPADCRITPFSVVTL